MQPLHLRMEGRPLGLAREQKQTFPSAKAVRDKQEAVASVALAAVEDTQAAAAERKQAVGTVVEDMLALLVEDMPVHTAVEAADTPLA